MRLIVDIESFDGFQKRIWMAASELLQVGRSSQADVCIAGDSRLSEIHFAIEGSVEGWTLIAARGARVGVNGVPVQRHRLQDGDLILAGQTEFRISIERPVQPAVLRSAIATPAAPVAPRQPATFQTDTCKSGVVQLSVQLNDTPLAMVLEKLAGTSSIYMAFNEQRFGRPLPGLIKLTEDLFELAPDEIRATDSLVVARFDSSEQTLAAISQAAQTDATVLFVSAAAQESMLAEQKIGWAWYARPSILKQQLSLGSKELAKKLLASIEAAILLSPQEQRVTALIRSGAEAAIIQRLASLQ